MAVRGRLMGDGPSPVPLNLNRGTGFVRGPLG